MNYNFSRIKSALFFKKNYIKFIIFSKLQRKIKADPNICFLCGCGRSGTTILGKIIAASKNVIYLNEPRELWMTINKATDIWGYTNSNNINNEKLIKSANIIEKNKFNNIFIKILSKNKKIIVEKSPENIFRLEWLNGLSPDCKIIIIGRYYKDVIRSIVKESSFNIGFGFKEMNNWYGYRNKKKLFLKNIAHQLGIDRILYQNIQNCQEWAALEWLCSYVATKNILNNIKKNRVMICSYDDLINNSEIVIKKIFSFLKIEIEEYELLKAISLIRKKESQEYMIINSPIMHYIEENCRTIE